MNPAAALERVRALLAAVGYDEPNVRGLLGGVDPDLSPDEQAVLWSHRARSAAPLAVLVRLFMLGESVPLPLARRALGELEPWLRSGLAARRARVLVPRAQLSLHGHLVVASDPPGAPVGRAVVLPATNATLALDRMVFRDPVPRALDLGTGAGLLALRLSSHAETVVASDVAPRALAWVEVNAQLNGRTNIETARSDAYRGLRGRRFHLVVGNLPFVISPERRFVYRDGGRGDDGFFAGVVRATGRHLEEGGHALLLGQWVHRPGDDEEVRLARWVVASGCDALVVRLGREPVDRYAARWSNGPAAEGRQARARRFERWMAFYRRHGIESISTGVFVLRRRASARHALAVEETNGELPDAATLRAWTDAAFPPMA